MRKNQSATHVRRLLRALTTSVAALATLFLLVTLLAWTYQPVSAQGGGSGTFTHDSVANFGGACFVLTNIAAQPALTDAIVSSANGGEIRLRATVEDYFDGSAIDATQWITGFSNPSFPEQAPIIGSGVLTLYGSYLRSVEVFSATTPTRFFEARAQFADSRRPSNADIGYYRNLPPLQSPSGENSIRLFVAQPSFSPENNSLLYVRSRDGAVAPYVDTMVYNWGSEADDQRIGMAQYRNYRVEWDASETWYLVDDAVIDVDPGDDPLPHTGVSTRTTYVFLYNQDPLRDSGDYTNTTPLLIDWVRAGVYPSSGEYVSCIQDAGQVANWSQAVVTATVPAGTGVQLATRTSVDGVAWSAWTAAAGTINSGASTLTPASPSGRYLQYRLALTSSDPINSPEVGALTFSYFGPTSLVVAPPAPTLNPGEGQQFAATVRDANNNVVNGAPIAWTANSGGVINNSGLFTAGLPAGLFANAVRATTSSNISGTATVTVRDLPPTVNAGGPYTGQEGQAVSLAANASDPNGGAIAAYDWDLDNDGQFDDATGATTTASWNDEGVYTIGVRATDSGSLTGTATTTVTIANVAPQITSVTNSGPVRRNQPVTVTVTATDTLADALTYSFDWNSDGNFDITDQAGNSATTSYPNTGVYTATVRVRDGDGGETTATTVVTVTPQTLSATATNSSPARRGQPVMVTASAGQELADALTYSFDWTSDGNFDITDQAGNSATTSYPNTGVYTATVRVRDADGGQTMATTVVTVTPQTLSATATNSSPVRRGRPVTVTVSAAQELADALTYGFDFDGSGNFEVVQAGNAAATSYASTGVRNVNFGVVDSDGGAVTGTTTITVTPQVLTIGAVSNSGPVLRNQPVTVIVTATQELGDALRYSFDWNNDGLYDIVDQPASSATTSYSTIGNQVVRVRVRDADGGEISNTTTVQVAAQIIQISAVNSNAPVRRGQPVTVTVVAVQQLNEVLLYSFDWDNNGVYDVVDQTASSASTNYATRGDKPIRVRVRDQQNSEASQTATVQIVAQNLTLSAANNGPVRRDQEVLVTATASQELSDALRYSFDWNNDGVYEIENQASNSATTSYPATGSKTVGVRVRDADGGVATGATTITVTPQTLTLNSVANSGPVQVGAPVQVTVDVAQELSDALHYSFDWDNDGVYDVVDQAANSAATTYTEVGLKPVAVRVVDADGGVVTGTTTVEVNTVGGEGEKEFLYMPIIAR
jgi:hypothetical protein